MNSERRFAYDETTRTLIFVIAMALVLTVCSIMTPEIVFASAVQIESKLKNAADVVKGVLTALVVLVGICAALFIIKGMPLEGKLYE